MQNTIEEIYSQLAFLQISAYKDWKRFRAAFVLPLKHRYQRKDVMLQFQTVLTAFLLRRTKKSKIDGVEILKGLPKKDIKIVPANFKEKQQKIYKDWEIASQNQMRKYQDEGTLGRNYGNMLTMLLRLRQACLHPYLIEECRKSRSLEVIDEQEIALARKFSEQTVLGIKEIDVFVCLDCHEAVFNLSLVLPCGHHV